MGNNQEGEYLTVRELAREWKQHESTIYKKVERGLIPSVRLGDETSALRIPRSGLERMLSTVGARAKDAGGER
jgi:excisionase family DNA binding protein